MVLRVLIWAVLIFAAWWFLKPRARGKPVPPPGAAASARAQPAPPPAQARITGPEPMRACAFCGIHFPESEARRDPVGRVFCCREHLAFLKRDDE